MLFLVAGGRFFRSTRATENIVHPVIAFMAGVFPEWTFCLCPLDLDSPRLVPAGIVHGVFILQCVVVEPAELLNDIHGRAAHATERVSSVEIGCFNNECVSIPISAVIASPRL